MRADIFSKSKAHEIYKLAILQNRGTNLETSNLSAFRSFVSRTLLQEEEDLNIKHLLDMQGMVLFFKKDKDYFGANEDSRVIFARMKHPDDETPSGWADEASFVAENLTKMIQGKPSQSVFSKSDLKSIKVIDRDEAIEHIKETAHESGDDVGPVKTMKITRLIFKHDRDEAPNFIRADEE